MTNLDICGTRYIKKTVPVQWSMDILEMNGSRTIYWWFNIHSQNVINHFDMRSGRPFVFLTDRKEIVLSFIRKNFSFTKRSPITQAVRRMKAGKTFSSWLNNHKKMYAYGIHITRIAEWFPVSQAVPPHVQISGKWTGLLWLTRSVRASSEEKVTTRVGTLIVATIYLQLIQNRYMFRSFTVLQCSHQHCVQPVAIDVEVVGYL